MRSPAEALDLIRSSSPLLPAADEPVDPRLAGRVLAADVRAAVDLPPFATSSMDGYAVRAADLGDGPLPVAFRVAAGDRPARLPPGVASGVATGAPLPDGADAVVPIEDAEERPEGLVAAAPTPGAWVRQGGRNQPLARRLGAPKALVLDVLSARFRRRATAAGIPFNPAFAGAYDFTKSPDFGDLMRQFIAGMPEGGLVMCHPGFVDDTLASLDPLTTQREAEHTYLAGDQFPPLLAANNVTLG